MQTMASMHNKVVPTLSVAIKSNLKAIIAVAIIKIKAMAMTMAIAIFKKEFFIVVVSFLYYLIVLVFYTALF